VSQVYTLDELYDTLYDEYLQDTGQLRVASSVEMFIDWMRRREEIDAILETERTDAEDCGDEPVDLFGVAGVPGLATRAELDALTIFEPPELTEEDDIGESGRCTNCGFIYPGMCSCGP